MIDANMAKALYINKQEQIKRNILIIIHEDRNFAMLFKWITDKIYFSIENEMSCAYLDKIEMASKFLFIECNKDWRLFLGRLGYRLDLVEESNTFILSGQMINTIGVK